MGIFRNNNDENNRGSSPFAGFGGRLLIGIGIALIGLFMYMSQEQENPITKERQHVNISTSKEIKLGLDAAPMMSRKMGGELPASDPRAQEVQKIGNFLVSSTISKESPWKFQFHLLADKNTINAFALPGGQIFITVGLYDKLQTEAQLAGVLAHEMGHVIERHAAQQMAKGDFGKMIITAITVASSDQHQSGPSYPSILASIVNQVVQLKYSRKDESQADIWGIKLMTQSGYNPKSMIEVMKILKASGGHAGGMPEIFQTHPNPDLRMQQIEAYLKEHPQAGNFTDGKNLREIR